MIYLLIWFRSIKAASYVIGSDDRVHARILSLFLTKGIEDREQDFFFFGRKGPFHLEPLRIGKSAGAATERSIIRGHT
jgi:hypothetical protein